MLKNGIKGKEIAKILSVSEGHVSKVKKAYEAEGIKGIKPKQMGRKKGDKRILSPEQEAENDPMQLKFKECMWTRKKFVS